MPQSFEQFEQGQIAGINTINKKRVDLGIGPFSVVVVGCFRSKGFYLAASCSIKLGPQGI